MAVRVLRRVERAVMGHREALAAAVAPHKVLVLQAREQRQTELARAREVTEVLGQVSQDRAAAAVPEQQVEAHSLLVVETTMAGPVETVCSPLSLDPQPTMAAAVAAQETLVASQAAREAAVQVL